jgi:hypothetical protein
MIPVVAAVLWNMYSLAPTPPGSRILAHAPAELNVAADVIRLPEELNPPAAPVPEPSVTQLAEVNAAYVA